MAYPFVPAKWFTPGAIDEYRAVVLHMAEGGGTVSYLTHPRVDVSASHVVEYSGRIVQMVHDGDASHCQHTSPEPYKTADYGTFSSTIGRQVLGDGWSNVNRYVFAVEIEGFRADGPNPAQAAALKLLVADLRARFPSIRGLLGHRDIQDKPCPGGRIPWASLGGHGLVQEDEVIGAIKGEDWTPTVTNGQSNGVYRAAPDRAADFVARLPAGTIVRTIAEVAANGENWRLSEVNGAPAYFLRGDLEPLVPGGDPAVDKALTDYITRVPPAVADCAPAVAAATLAGRRTEWDRQNANAKVTLAPKP